VLPKVGYTPPNGKPRLATGLQKSRKTPQKKIDFVQSRVFKTSNSRTLPFIASHLFNMVVDVIIVGGGLSGMSAAYDVHNAGKTVLVLEARDRVVGKTCSVDTVTGEDAILGERGSMSIRSIASRR